MDDVEVSYKKTSAFIISVIVEKKSNKILQHEKYNLFAI
jgi:hypothetical protein